jgi:Mn-containing catalase
MYANVATVSTGRPLATRSYEPSNDAGMHDMLSFLIAPMRYGETGGARPT